jgi:hypothetical protein
MTNECTYVMSQVEDMRVPVIGKGKADDVQNESEGRGNGGW